MKTLILFLFAFTAAASAQTNCVSGPFATTTNLGFKLPFLNQCLWGAQGYNVNFTDIDAMFPSGVLTVAHGGTGTATPALIAGTNITITGTWPNQTINSTASAGGTWGSITGTLASQTDLQTALNLKAALISPAFTTPNLGTPSAGVLTNATGLPESGVTNLVSDLALKAALASPTFTGTVGLPANQTITTPTIASFTNATHGHANAAGGGQLGVSAVSATGTPGPTTFWRGDNTWSTAGTSSPGGSTTQVQFNDAGSLGGDAGLLYNKTTDFVTAGYLGSKTGPWIDPTAWGADATGATESTTAWQAAVDQMEASGGAIICKGSFKIDRVQLAGQDTIRGVANQGNKGCSITPKTDAAFVNKTPTNPAAGPFTITDIHFTGGSNVIDFGVGGVGITIERNDFDEVTGCAVMIGVAEHVKFNDNNNFQDTATGTALLCTGNYARSLFSGVLPGTDGGIADITANRLKVNGSIGSNGGSIGSLVLAEGEGWGEADAGTWACFYSCTTQLAQFGNNTGIDAFVDGSRLTGVTTDHIGPGGATKADYVLRFAGVVNDATISNVTPCFNGQQATTQMYIEVMAGTTLSDNYFCNTAQGADNVTTFGLKFGNRGGTYGTIMSTRGAVYNPTILGENGISIIGSFLKPTTFPAGGQLTDLTNTGIQMVMGNTVGAVNDTATTSSFSVVRGVGDGATYTNDLTSNGTSLLLNENIGFTKILLAKTAPTISSGFGTSPSITGSNGSATFRLNVGTGGSATGGIIAMSTTATTGWNCSVNDLTAAAAHVAYNTRQTASSTTTVTVENQTTSTGAAVAWAASDILTLNCFAY